MKPETERLIYEPTLKSMKWYSPEFIMKCMKTEKFWLYMFASLGVNYIVMTILKIIFTWGKNCVWLI